MSGLSTRGRGRGTDAKGRTWRELRQLLRLPGFRKLFAVRLVSQTADGMFQVGLATLLFFSPESMGTAAGVAAGFAVMLAPFTVVGPFAGVLLDRWPRRQILLFGNLVRAVITAAMAFAFLRHGEFSLVHILGLAALSINRFLLAGLSAGLPKIISDDVSFGLRDSAMPLRDPQNDEEGVPYAFDSRRPQAAYRSRHSADGFAESQNHEIPDLLLTANSLVPTIGAGAAFLGGGIGLLLSMVLGHQAGRDDLGNLNSSVTLFASAVTMVFAALVATRLSVYQLGPENPPAETFRQGLARVVRDLVGAGRYLRYRVTPAQGLLAISIHRFLFGLVFIAAILMSRNILTAGADAGLAQFAAIMGLIGAGGAIAVVLTPLLSRTMGPQRWVAAMFLVAAGAMLLLSTVPYPVIVFATALILGVGSQGAKIAVDTIVQRDTEDAYRGRAFAFYDVLFNAAFVAAAGLAAFIVPDLGWSRPLFWIIALCYILTAVWMYFRGAKQPPALTQCAAKHPPALHTIPAMPQ